MAEVKQQMIQNSGVPWIVLEWLAVLNESYFTMIMDGGNASTIYHRSVTGGDAFSTF